MKKKKKNILSDRSWHGIQLNFQHSVNITGVTIKFCLSASNWSLITICSKGLYGYVFYYLGEDNSARRRHMSDTTECISKDVDLLISVTSQHVLYIIMFIIDIIHRLYIFLIRAKFWVELP